MVRHSGQFQKNQIPWNKGFCHLSDEAKRRISESKKGKPLSEETKRKISIAGKGRTHSEETKKKISDGLKGKNKGKKHIVSDEHRRNLSKALKGVPKKYPPWNKGKEFLKGEMNPRWLGGISFEPYCEKFNDMLKETIRTRDNHTCQLCGIKQEEHYRKLDVHHIHYDKPNCDPDLITLCMKCNQRVNTNRDYYETLFMQKLADKGSHED